MQTNDRILRITVVCVAGLAVLWGRCVWLQVLGAKRFVALAESQRQSVQLIRATRGTVYDANGRTMALTALAPSVFADPRRVVSKTETARRLADAVGRAPEPIRRRLEKDKGFVWIARQADPAVVPVVAQMHREGIGIREESKRLYPQGMLAAHLLGFVDIDQQGLEGLELQLNGALQGQHGWRSTLRDAKGAPLVGPWTNQAEPIDGSDVTLTIDSVVQQVAEEALAWGVRQYHAKGGSVVIMNPATGAVLAMATSPSYDPNEPARVPADARRNRAVTDLFEPGSTFKIVTAAALLQEGRVTPEEPFYCEDGAWPTIGRHILHDHRPHGMLPFAEVIKFSSNIGTAKAAQRLKPDELYRYIRAFGFGQKTGIDVPGEVRGLVPPPSRWSKLSPFIIPIGQEVASTPLQLAVMTSVIANGGLRVQPHIIERIQSADGRLIKTAAPAAPVRVISPETASTVQAMLAEVVKSGTGQLAKVNGLTAAGKTGTAQKLEPNGRYSHSRFVASFVGFVPVPDPHVAIVVCIDEPRPLYFGGVVSAPIFKRIVEQLASYWGLEPREYARSD